MEHAFRQQPVAGAQRVQQDDVVRAFADRLMELDVDRRLCLEIAGRMRRLHALDDAVEQREIVGGGAPRGIVGGDALDLAAVFEVVGGRLAVGGDELRHRLGEDLADHVGDIGAAAMPWSSAGRAPPGPSARRAGSAATRRTARASSRSPGRRSPTRSTPSRMSASICCTTSSAVRECSILEKISPNGESPTCQSAGSA